MAYDRATNQVGFVNDQLNQFVSCRELFSQPVFFVNRMAGIEKGRDWIIAEDHFNLFNSQWLFGVIALDQDFGGFFAQMFAQETPGVSAGGSGAFVKETNHLINEEFGRMNDEKQFSLHHSSLTLWFSLPSGQ